MKHRTTIFRDADTGAAAGANPAAAAGGAPAAGSGAPAGDLAGFLGGINPDVRSLIETKGWHKDAASPAQVLERVASGYGALEKTVGLDKVPLPAPGADGKRDWLKNGEQVFKALGRPDSPEGYKFAPEEGKQFTPEQVATQKALAAAAHKFGLADWQVQGMGAAIAAIAAGQEGQSAEAVTAETAATETALRAKWGQAYDSKIHAADLALSKAPPELAAKIVKAGLGRDPAFLEMFAAYGEKMGEDPTPGNLGANGGSGAKANTPQQAQAEIARIMGDPAQTAILGNREHPEYRAYNDRMQRLYAEAYPEPNQ